MTPISLAIFVREEPGVHRGYEYSRTNNLTRQALQECLASPEGAAHGLAFAWHVGRDTVAHAAPGDHIVLGNDAYGARSDSSRLCSPRWASGPP